MNINELSAKELARIDAICLEYEEKLRRGTAEPVEVVVEKFGGKYAAILQAELEAVAFEISAADELTRAPFIAGEDVDGVHPFSPPVQKSKFANLSAGMGQDSPTETLPTPGRMVGPYLLGEVLGRGGMGIVFKATDTRLERQVAIKMLAVTGKNTEALADRFQREAKAVAGLSHPNIVELFDVGVVDGVPYAVMEYLRGDVLVDRLDGKAIPAEEVRRLGAMIADALTAAHTSGVIHRDLKPHNIILVQREGGVSLARQKSGMARSLDLAAAANAPVANSPVASAVIAKASGEIGSRTTIVKLIDFGLSRRERDADADTGKTKLGTVMGTPGYMSPEQARGEEVTYATDIFGLGCILFEAFYGTRAFDGESSSQRFAAVLESNPITDEVRRRDDPELAWLIDRCLAKRMEDRPQTAAEIASALRNDYVETSAVETGLGGVATTRRRFVESIAGAMVGAIGGPFLAKDYSDELSRIRSIAVVSFNGARDTLAPEDFSTAAKTPVGDRGLLREEEVAGMLAQELQRIPSLVVRPFRPIVVRTPEDYRALGRELDVDAILTGLYYNDQRGSKSFVEITLQLVSTRTGDQIWTKRVVAEKATSLIEQNQLVAKLAESINQRLIPRADASVPSPTGSSFGCLAKGHTYLDPDNTVEGLEMAVACFEHALSEDARFPDAHAGLALTQIAIATRGNDTDVGVIVKRIQQARTGYEEALLIDPSTLDARLAQAILRWQTMFEYEAAHDALEDIAIERQNDWRIRHQLGLLETTQGDDSAATRSLLFASQLNPQSGMIRADQARLEWFAGSEDKVIKAGLQILDAFPNHRFASGLLLDVYEESGNYDLASKLLTGIQPNVGRSFDSYFAARSKTLVQLPYGPYGALLNQAIFDGRRSKSGVSEAEFVRLADAQLPALSMLLNRHPVFHSAKTLDRAKLMLPS